MNELVKSNYQYWVDNVYFGDDAKVLKSLSEDEIYDAFYKELEFGTGGLRAIMGVGTNRLNVYSIARATLGVGKYAIANKKNPTVVIAHDSRNNSELFTKVAAAAFASLGIRVYIYPDVMPTPTLSFAVNYLHCDLGVVCTASHNPKEYNGYKVYDEFGCQIGIEIADVVLKNISESDYFEYVYSEDKYNKSLKDGMINVLGEDIIKAIVNYELGLSNRINEDKHLVIAYTPLNGAGYRMIPEVLKAAGYNDVSVVEEQGHPDGNFPTCPKPNPELHPTLDLGVKLLKEKNADILLASDPDADRIACVVNHHGELVYLTGNQVGALLVEYFARTQDVNNKVVVKTIVSTDLIKTMAKAYNIEVREVLTGFKFIGEQIEDLIDKGTPERYLLGFEESCGYLTSTYVKDKDAINAALLVADMADYFKSQGLTLVDVLNEMEAKFGCTETCLYNFDYPGESGFAKMKEIMASFKGQLGYEGQVALEDYADSVRTFVDGRKETITLPKSDVLKFLFDNGSSATVRPSGTEPKIKCYFYLQGKDKKELEAIKDKYLKIFLPKLQNN